MLKNSMLLWPLVVDGRLCAFAMGSGRPTLCGLSSDGWTKGEHRQLAKVLGGCRERKFVVCASGTAQSEPIQLQDALQVGNSISIFFRSRRDCRYSGVSLKRLATSREASCTLRMTLRQD
jgi:hypothetical protein